MPEKLFGVLREPIVPAYREGEAVLSHEVSTSPESMMTLNQENSVKIKSFFDTASENEVLKGFYENILLIYAVDGGGNIYLAIEELYSETDKGIGHGIARLVEHKPHEGLPKLGHPSLLSSEDKKARLAGEIFYKDGVWRINGRSGRYTKPSDGNKGYVNNVAELFSGFGIVLKSE